MLMKLNLGVTVVSDKKINFEESLSALEKIISALENGECSLDKSIELFEEGMKHIKDCRTALNTAEMKINALTDIKEE